MPEGTPLRRAAIVERLVRLAPDSLGIGPAAVDGAAEPVGPKIVQVAVAVSSIVIHSGMYFYSGLSGFLWVTLLSLAYLTVGIPISFRAAEVSTSLATWIDLLTLSIAAALLGDPATLVAWFPLVVVANLLYLPTVLSIRNMVGMVGFVAAFFVISTWYSDRLFTAGVLRVYFAATLVMWFASAAVYALAVGGAVGRREAAISDALAQRDAAELRARSDAARLRAVLEEAPIGLLLQAADESFVYGNAPALEMLGITLDELLTSGAVSAMEPATRDLVEAEIVGARVSGKPFQIEHQTIGGRILELRGRHVELDEGFATVTAMRDLTPERDAYRHIARLRTLVENSETHMVVWDSDGEILIGNRVFRELWNRGEPVVGRSIVELAGEQVRPLVEMDLLGEERTYERSAVLPDGSETWVSIAIFDFQDPFDGRWLRSASVRDLAEVALARRQLEELVASKDQFIASVSHELRTPLTVVVGLAAEMASNPSALAPEEIAEFSSLIAGQATEVAALVEDLLTMARADAGVLSISPQVLELGRSVEEVIAGLPRELRDRITWVPGSDSTVHADPVRVRQIIRNLLTNAGRHGGPRIEIEVQSRRVVVRDDGPPVPESQRERMFEAYERVHDRAGTPDSVGLGLTVCRRLSLLMGGDVDYTHDGTWSTFSLTLVEA